MHVLGMLRADHFVYDNERGLRTRRKGWPRDASAELGQGQIQGYSDGRKKFVTLVVRKKRTAWQSTVSHRRRNHVQ